jgi:hypothetical protein
MNSYSRAVDRFLSLAQSPVQQAIDNPRALSRNTSIATSTGYRSVAALESAGILARDLGGEYLRGPDAMRIGLSAWGLGRIAGAVDPVLSQLRRETGRTAFLGMLDDTNLVCGPFSLGRGPDFILPEVAGYLTAEINPIGGLLPFALSRSDDVREPNVSRYALVRRFRVAPCCVGLLLRRLHNEEVAGFETNILSAAGRLETLQT